MGATTDYLATLKEKLNADAKAKKDAYDAALQRATQATFDAQGRPTYSKDDQGQNRYGTLDVGYLNQERNIGVQSEASGMMRSGQTARQYATNLAGYKADVLAAQNAATEGKSAVDTATGLETAKYEAMYGTPGSAATGGALTPTTTTTTNTKTTVDQAPGLSKTGVVSTGTGGAAAGKNVSASWLPKGQNPYSYVGPKPVTKAPVKTIPKVPPVRRTGPL